MKKTAKKLALSRETLIHLEQVVGGVTILCTYTQAQTCRVCPTTVQPCLTTGCGSSHSRRSVMRKLRELSVADQPRRGGSIEMLCRWGGT